MKFSKSNVSTTPCFAFLWECIGIHLDSFKIYSPLSELAMKLGLHKDDKGAGAGGIVLEEARQESGDLKWRGERASANKPSPDRDPTQPAEQRNRRVDGVRQVEKLSLGSRTGRPKRGKRGDSRAR